MKQKQPIVEVQLFEPERKRRKSLIVIAYGKQWKVGKVKHGDTFRCPEIAIDNERFFLPKDFPKEEVETMTDASDNSE